MPNRIADRVNMQTPILSHVIDAPRNVRRAFNRDFVTALPVFTVTAVTGLFTDKPAIVVTSSLRLEKILPVKL